MPRRQPPPRLLLMTDERMGEELWRALARLPRGAGVVFRHHATPPAERRALFERVRRSARARGLWLILAGSPAQATGWRADGVHGGSRQGGARPLLRTRSAHDRAELVAARRARADLVLLSPVFATRSHPGGRVLGPARFGLLAAAHRRQGRGPAVLALGGMTAARFRRVRGLGAGGWAAIDALAASDRPQNLKVVPR
jgi:thiamine-phosphate pyrophosphorylase